MKQTTIPTVKPIIFDPKDRESLLMKPSTKPGPPATFVTTHEARKLATVGRYGR